MNIVVEHGRVAVGMCCAAFISRLAKLNVDQIVRRESNLVVTVEGRRQGFGGSFGTGIRFGAGLAGLESRDVLSGHGACFFIEFIEASVAVDLRINNFDSVMRLLVRFFNHFGHKARRGGAEIDRLLGELESRFFCPVGP